MTKLNSSGVVSIKRVVHSPLRIARPAIREGWKEHRPRTGNEPFREVSWDEALDDIAAKLRKTIDAHGPDSIGMYFGSGLGIDSTGYVMMEAFYNALGTPPKIGASRPA